MLRRALMPRARHAHSLHVVERRHRDGLWLPVALAVPGATGASAMQAYRRCLPRELWKALTLRARLQGKDEFAGLVPGNLLAAH